MAAALGPPPASLGAATMLGKLERAWLVGWDAGNDRYLVSPDRGFTVEV